MEWDVKRLDEPKEFNILDETYNRLVLLLNENEKASMSLLFKLYSITNHL